MEIFEFTLLLIGGSFLAGLLGALTGLGGGVVIVPLLVLAFGIDLRYAIGASLVSVEERDRLYVVVSMFVLGVLLYSLFGLPVIGQD